MKQTAIFAVAVFLAVFFVAPVLAQQPPALNLGLEYADYTGLANTDIRMIIAKIIRVALGLLGLVALCFTIYGGYVYMTAGGNEEKIATAKKILKNMVIGLAIILSALSIVQFIIRAIYGEYAEKYGPGQEWPSGYSEEFVIGGFLGSVIESHYPGRNATDIPRNTKIVITFRQKIKPESLLVDSNGDRIYGNLVNNLSDQINADNLKIYPTVQGETAALGTLPDTDVFAYLGEDGRTIVLKPKNYLGDPKQEVNYTVKLTNGVKLADGSDAFRGIGGYYSWQFTVSTKDDKDPPKVESVVPLPADKAYPRNIIVQINFNEPVDPISASGIYKAGDSSKNFQNITIASSAQLVSGEFKIANQYRTIEFVSDDQCGVNPCGQPVYCLPADAHLTSRVKTATLDPSNIPQAQITGNLYDGVVDLAGNVLNGGGELRLANGKLELTPGVLTDWSAGADKSGLNSGLVGWWSLDQSDIKGTTVMDKSGWSNNGTIFSHPSSAEGLFGQAFDFGDDSASYINIPSSPSLDALLDSSFSFSLWFKAGDWARWPENTYGELLVKGSGGYPGQGIYTGVNSVTKQVSLSWRCVPDAGLEFCNSLGNDATQEQRDSCTCGLQLYSPALEAERWYNFVVTAEWDGAKTTVGLYLDGRLVSQNTKNKKIRNVSEAMKINLNSPNHFFGLIDEIRVYNRALMAKEINDLYNSSQLAQGLLAYWTFDTADVDNALVYDRSGHDNHGLNTGIRLVSGAIGQAGKCEADTYARRDWPDFNLAAVSFSFWLRADQRDTQYHDLVGLNLADRNFFHLCRNGAICWYDAMGIKGNVISTQVVPVVNQWYHVVGTFDGAEARIYVNGKLEKSQDRKMANFPTTSLQVCGSTEPFFGSIDDVRLYNRALSVKEIQELHGLYTPVSGGFAFDDFWWKFSTSAALDTISPKLSIVNPVLQASGVSPKSPLLFTFDKLMSVGSFRDIILKINKDFNVWYTSASRQLTANNSEVKEITDVAHHTQAELLHGDFWQKPPGSSEPEAVYYPFVPSTVLDIYQNCFYPAVGPGRECQAGAGPDKLNDANPSCYDGHAKAGASFDIPF